MDYADQRRDMVQALQKDDRIVTPAVTDAIGAVPRERFLPPELRPQAYRDNPLPIGQGQTMSAPHMVAIMSEALELARGQKILEVGTGSGYHAAVTTHIVSPGLVVSIEWVEELAARARENLSAAGVETVKVLQGDGSLGHAAEAPYDRIYLTCATPSIPASLLQQLKDPGILLAPIGHEPSKLIRLRRRDGRDEEEDLGPCSFVPMMGPPARQD